MTNPVAPGARSVVPAAADAGDLYTTVEGAEVPFHPGERRILRARVLRPVFLRSLRVGDRRVDLAGPRHGVVEDEWSLVLPRAGLYLAGAVVEIEVADLRAHKPTRYEDDGETVAEEGELLPDRPFSASLVGDAP